MSDWLLLQLAVWGAPILLIGNFLSCVAFPIPASVMMLAAGAFCAAGDLDYFVSLGACYIGAVLGDQAGYYIGFSFGPRLNRFMSHRRKRAKLMKQAQGMMDKWGGIAVFFTRWILSPLGPYTNFACGAMGFSHRKFTFWTLTGEGIWVVMYVSLGYLFADSIRALGDFANEATFLLAAAVVMFGLGSWLLGRLREIPKPD